MVKRTATKKRAGQAKSTVVPRPMAAAPGALGAAADGTLLTEGFITISIGEEKFELRGIVGGYIKVEYHKSFEDALALDTIPNIVGSVAKALGVPNAAEFATKLTAMLEDLESVPLVKPAATILKDGVVKVTDLGIDTQMGKYEFGFGVDLVGKNISCGGISLDAFGLLFTYTKPKEAT
jgi:hypothetical protein